MAALALGLGMFFMGVNRPSVTAPDPFRGNIFAALAGVSWALTLIGLRWISRPDDPGSRSAAAAVLSGNVFAFLVCLPWALPLATTRATDWLILSYMGVFQIGLGYVLFTAGVRLVPALEASLLLLLEPVLNPVWAWIIHGESPGVWAIIGGTIILLATTLKTLDDFRCHSSSDHHFRD
jgi:drug/metabolite transporter (DMT)-like permease